MYRSCYIVVCGGDYQVLIWLHIIRNIAWFLPTGRITRPASSRIAERPRDCSIFELSATENGAITGAFAYAASSIASDEIESPRHMTTKQYIMELKRLGVSSDWSVSPNTISNVDALLGADPSIEADFEAKAQALYDAAIACSCETQELRVFMNDNTLSIDLVQGSACNNGSTTCIKVPLPNGSEGKLVLQMHAHPIDTPYPSPADIFDSAHLSGVPGIIWSNSGNGSHDTTWYQGRCLPGRAC